MIVDAVLLLALALVRGWPVSAGVEVGGRLASAGRRGCITALLLPACVVPKDCVTAPPGPPMQITLPLYAVVVHTHKVNRCVLRALREGPPREEDDEE